MNDYLCPLGILATLRAFFVRFVAYAIQGGALHGGSYNSLLQHSLARLIWKTESYSNSQEIDLCPIKLFLADWTNRKSIFFFINC
jgi:hypothetical protein